jgi:hypothetical protein
MVSMSEPKRVDSGLKEAQGLALPVAERVVEIRNVRDIPESFGQPITLIPQHPVKFSEPTDGYEYYGRKGIPGQDLVAMRWCGKDQSTGNDNFKLASPVKISEIKTTYAPISEDTARSLGLSSSTDIFIKIEPTKVYLVPEGIKAIVYSSEQSVEEIVGGSGVAVAIDSVGNPYKFPYKKNIEPGAGLPPAYIVKE